MQQQFDQQIFSSVQTDAQQDEQMRQANLRGREVFEAQMVVAKTPSEEFEAGIDRLGSATRQLAQLVEDNVAVLSGIQARGDRIDRLVSDNSITLQSLQGVLNG